MTLHLRELTPEERSHLEKLAYSRTAPAQTVERAQILWQSSQGDTAPSIAAELRLDGDTVRRRINRFNAEGLGALEDRRRSGRPATYSPEQVAAVIAAALSKLLADTYTLYLKTQGFHWNIIGPRFHDLHNLFEEQYTELAAANDEIAERIRALGAKAPASYSEFKKLASVTEEVTAPAANEMIRQLLADNRSAVRAAQNVVEAAEEHGDLGSADLATQRIRAHEKAAWMLDALLQAAG